jgi:hypothetical protein
MYPLASSFSFRDVTIGTMAVSKVETPLPVFPVEPLAVEDGGRFLAKVEMDAEMILGSFGPREHDALVTEKLLNGGQLNRVIEQMGIPYAPCPLPVTKASQAVTRKWKANMLKKAAAKKPKVAQSGKAILAKTVAQRSIITVVHLKAKPGLKVTSKIELILVKPVGVSKFFCLSDVPGSSQSQRDEGHHAG